MSSVYMGDPFNIVSRNVDHCPNYTNNVENSWVEIDLGPRRLFLADFYTLRHGSSSTGNALRSWVLEAKVNNDPNTNWVLLKIHENDESLSEEPNSSSSWEINALSEESDDFSTSMIGFRMFRITSIGMNSSGNNCLFCCGLELYGILFEQLVDVSPHTPFIIADPSTLPPPPLADEMK
jgi:hypothetical protein